jgi:hypothetical protein
MIAGVSSVVNHFSGGLVAGNGKPATVSMRPPDWKRPEDILPQARGRPEQELGA